MARLEPSVRLAAALLVLGSLPHGASAQTPASACDRFGGYELQNCLAGALAKADKALNAAYQKALAAIAADADTPADQKVSWKQNLIAAQRAWLGFRDANCLFDLIGAEWHFGTGTTAAQQQCVLTMTQQRTAELLARIPSDG
ncbi:lysozyme inhibitor LprI family protein [Ancylobacter radicis]|uniref:DUF1311 domain-containing protein n=1 Tax=Ancylobacter radicis TaxID=2836179 RepID=A0ABS5R7U3_9HYPH|nr:lysozyme inhibitor LprI family protein [Ancylobacter radicis]MBS9476442.1 DUF1311 domain-containing protein [Ancylobacter radicis]